MIQYALNTISKALWNSIYIAKKIVSDSTRVIIKFGELYPFFSLIWVEKLLLSVWISDETLLKVTLFNVASSFGYDTGINESPPPCVWYVTKTLSPNIMDVRLVTRSTFVDQQVVQPVAQYMLSTMSSKV